MSSQYIWLLENCTRQSGGCILWPFKVNDWGYGTSHYYRDGKRGGISAHRLAWIIANGEIPEDLQVRHKCDVPRCVNVKHLELGTAQDNANDKLLRGKNPYKLNDEEIGWILGYREMGWSYRKIAKELDISASSVSRVINNAH